MFLVCLVHELVESGGPRLQISYILLTFTLDYLAVFFLRLDKDFLVVVVRNEENHALSIKRHLSLQVGHVHQQLAFVVVHFDDFLRSDQVLV